MFGRCERRSEDIGGRRVFKLGWGPEEEEANESEGPEAKPPFEESEFPPRDFRRGLLRPNGYDPDPIRAGSPIVLEESSASALNCPSSPEPEP